MDIACVRPNFHVKLPWYVHSETLEEQDSDPGMVACAFNFSRGKRKITKFWIEPLVGDLTKSSLSLYLLHSWAHSVLQACSPGIFEGVNLKMDSMACGTQLPHLQQSIIWALLLGYIIGSTSQDSEFGYLWSEPSLQVYHREYSSGL